ncbi:RHS repeat domain-containing protein [Enhygromyxa salina]|uniref:tRNA(Glu)-specific nuclease WapA n=1 Tax=Enhygromyxa salina TaxID=215803 RepID=A0A2S9YXB6_9BACT|nr:RHS repeat-associated core domain-containing protein [Enhygromyxa salina]PRQ09712.1 tRNA(Glu)-specific nuclease WapA precursor [Enhygromyxa salina]
MSKQASSPSVPSIRSFQFNATTAGSVKDSVNLFRGDVNLEQPLFTMPGRTEATDVKVSLLYQSNVYHDAMTFNRGAPTSVVGLGWSCPGDAIELQGSPAEPAGARRYALVRNGGSNLLVREPEQPRLFDLSAAEAGSLLPGQPVSQALISSFGQRGLAVDPSATVAAAPELEGGLRIIDAAEQREFVLAPAGSGWTAFDGGEAYQLVQFQFSKVLYYPTWERWVVIDDAGQVSSYGGLADPAVQGFSRSVGDSVEWAVVWSSASGGAARWSGASSQPNGQRQVARAWNLASRTNLWGDQIRYAYNEQWPADPNTGVRPVVEQLVCSGGQPYTKACYLTSITDVFGRRAAFSYADKLWTSGTGSPREYADPHKQTPDNVANGWQDRYETQYLASIEVVDPEGERLYGIAFGYEPRPGNGSASAVANVNPSPTNGDSGDFYKRYLTSVTLSNEFGAAQPPICFNYYLDATQESGYSPGALASATSAVGGTSRWRYTEQQLDLCDRTLAVVPPAELGTSVTPRTWFGDDYAVTMWFDLLGNKASLAIHTWQGRWDAWAPAWGPILATEAAGFDLDSLEVVTGTDFVAISYVSAEQRKVYVFNKDPRTTGNWLPAEIADIETGPSTPCLSYSTSYGPATLAAGGTFFLVHYAPALQSYAYDRLTWRWSTREWSNTTDTLGDGAQVVARGEYCLTLDAQGRYALSYLDPRLIWRSGTSGTLSNLNDPSKAVLIPGASVVVVGQLLSAGSTSLSYSVTMLQWDADYQVQVTSFSATDSAQIDWVPQLIADTMVAVGGRLWRFDGLVWLLNEALVIATPSSGWNQRYAYGPDYAVQIYVDANEHVAPDGARVVGYDAGVVGAWNGARAIPSSASFGSTDAWPSAGTSDYLTLGEYLYYRNDAADWSTVIQAGPTENLADLIPAGEALETAATINQGPAFIAFNATVTATGARAPTAAFVLGNGQALAETDVGAGMRMIASSDPDYGQPGVSPAGPATLLLVPDTAISFTQAPSYALYRYVGNELDGKIRHYQVSTFETDNGFGHPLATAISIDPTTAACDPSGQFIKYYRSVVAPGVATLVLDPATEAPASGDAPYGFVAVRYLNGVEQVVGQELGASALDGMMLALEAHDSQGLQLSAAELAWEVYQDIAPDPSDASVPSRPLRGGFAVQSGGSLVQDGVSSTRTSSYRAAGFDAPFSTTPLSTTTSGMGSSGVIESQTSGSYLAIQLDDAVSQGVFRTLNLRAQAVQTTTQWQRAGENALTTAATATTWKAWASQLGASVVVPAKQASFAWLGDPDRAEFPFASYQPSSSVQGWRRTECVNVRNARGLSIESLDAMDVASSVLYDKSGSLPIAGLDNGSITDGQWAYLGFEAYEVDAGWTLAGTREVVGDAYFGGQSVGLGAAASVTTSVEVLPGANGYVLGFAIKTPVGFEPGAGTSWTIRYSGGGTAPEPIPLTATDGTWAFRSIGLPFEANARPSSITIAASNSTSVEILLDSVYLIPLGATFSAQAYEPRYNQTVSGMTMSGLATRSLYDPFRQVTGAIDERGILRKAGGKSLSRANSSDGQFSTSAPNGALQVVLAEAGICDDFRRGGEWRARWSPNNASAWTQAPGLLSTTDGGSLSWIPGPDSLTSAAVVVGIASPSGPSKSISLDFADNHTIAWEPGLGWTASGPAWSPRALAQPPSMAGDWLLVFGDGQLLFFAGNQLIYSSPWTEGVPSDITLIATGPLALRYLGVGGGPRVSLDYSDGNGVALQSQTLSGGDAAVAATITDALGRTVASTKFAPASFEKPTDLPILAYLNGFVDRQAFLAAMADSWVLTGTVADYYRGQTIDGYTPSDDGGYPYTGTRYELAPRGRKLESGLPGTSTAIHDVSQPPSTRQTTWSSYGCNAAINLGGVEIAAGSYYEELTTGPLGNATKRWRAFNRNQVAAELVDASADVLTQTKCLREWLEQRGHVVGKTQALTPNHFTNTQINNAVGETVVTESPGIAAGWTVRDPAGRTRIAGIGDATTVAYFVYDAIGRPLEYGRVEVDRDTLPQMISDPSWPLADSSRVVTRSFGYDGDGSDPSMLGQCETVTTTTAAATTVDPAATPVSVTETYSYDRRGRTTSMTQMVVDQPSLPSACFRYAYNNTDEIVCLSYPEGSPIPEVHYGYDDNGRLLAVGRAAGATDLASYTYSPSGDLIHEQVGAGVLDIDNGYGSQGWLATTSVAINGGAPCWEQAYVYNPDSTIHARTDTSAAPLPAGVTTHAFEYDPRKQLGSASASGALEWSESLSSTDQSGNILGAELDGVTMQATRAPDSDQILSLQVGEQQPVALGYDQFGNLSSVGSTITDYDPVLLLPSGFSGSGGAAVIGYGSANQRLIKQTLGANASTRLYFGGLSTRPLAVWENGRWSAAVQGATGLLATIGEQVCYPIKDALQSVRHLIDEQGNPVASLAYSAFGSVVAESGDTGALLSRFMGQELDGETGYYAFPARLYDPVLRRFHAVDPQHQFPSPYVFVGNQPISNVDPTGEVSWFGLVAMSVVFAAGFALSLASAGLSDVAAAAVDSLLGGAEVADVVEDTVVVGNTVSKVVKTGERLEQIEGLEEVKDETTALVRTGEQSYGSTGSVEPGVGSGAPLPEASVGSIAASTETAASCLGPKAITALTTVGHIGARTLGGAVMGAAENGALYMLNPRNNFDPSDSGSRQSLLKAMFVGAICGAVTGSAASLVDMPVSKGLMRKFVTESLKKQSLMVVAGKGVVGVGTSDINHLISAGFAHEKPTVLGMVVSAAWGGVSGAASSAMGESFSMGFAALPSRGKILAVSAGSALAIGAELQMVQLGIMKAARS